MARPLYRTAPVPSPGMPPGVPYIVGNEAAERFSFYGMRTILVIFMVKYLHLMGDVTGEAMSNAEANERFHHFVTAVYFFPIFGALIADAFLSKYRTIIWLSLVYCAGHGLLALMGSVGNVEKMFFWGLALIAIGSGGIKPCVSAHVGDQFGQTNRNLLTKIFNWFYFSINLGAFVSTLLTPWLLEWYGPHWAFGVPGILMLIATFFFWMGRWKFIHVPARGGEFLREVFSWEGVAALLKLSIIYVFVAVFWALFDQTGSSWVLQARDMNLNWAGIEWLPSQIQAINPILILCYIPLFTIFVYPTIDRVFPLTPLRKISIGLFLMVIGFGIVALAQSWIDAGERPSIGWQVVAYALLTASEIMVSIVCLEFSYTQAPRTMKSVIMALFLMSVSLGNYFTAGVNHFIQVPSTLQSADVRFANQESIPGKADAESNIVTLRGYDRNFGSEDDIVIVYEDGQRQSVAFPGREALDPLIDQIKAHIEANDWRVPDSATGEAFVAGITDPWDHPIRYKLLNSRECRLSSPGADGKDMTEWDQGVTIVVEMPKPKASGWFSNAMATIRPEKSWLETYTDAEPELEEPEISTKAFVGGLTKLEGASYFWFFTWIMLGAALAFLLVAKFYKPREYIHEESEDEHPIEPHGG